MRFGSRKLDADLHGQAIGFWPIRTAQRLGCPVVIVTGLQAPQFLAEATDPPKVIVNPDPARGMGGSIAIASAYARQQQARRLLIMLGDVPFVSPDTLRRLCEATPALGAAACRYPSGKLGPPACFDAELFPELERLEGDHGARRLLNDTDLTVGLPVDPEELRDIDTVEDLRELSRRKPGS